MVIWMIQGRLKMSNYTKLFLSQVHQKNSNVVINKLYLKATKYNYTLSAFIEKIVFLSNGQSPLGMSRFYITDEDLGGELGLSRTQICRLKSKLSKLPIGEFFSYDIHKIDGTPTTHWHVYFNQMCEYLISMYSNKKQFENNVVGGKH